MIILFFSLFIGIGAYTGPLPPSEALSQAFFDGFMEAVNENNQTAIKERFAPSFLNDAASKKIYENIVENLSNYTYSIEHAFYDVFEQPGKNTWILNTTVHFRGPEPTYHRINYQFAIENQNNNPQLYPDAWQIKAMVPIIYHRKHFVQNPVTPEMILGHMLSEFLNCVNTGDINRLQGMIEMHEVVSPTGMQQLREIVGGNRFEVRTYRIVKSGEISSTVIFTNPNTQLANLFWFVFKSQDERNPYFWKITDMKLMYGGFGPPRDFVGEFGWIDENY
ncbi:unnamed protein product [Caenorhabditis nigoni]